MTKQVYLDLAGRNHALLEELVLCPPSGYEFVVSNTPLDWAAGHVLGNERLYTTLVSRGLRKLVPLHLYKAYAEQFMKRSPPETVLTYAWGHPVFRKEPWILDLEWVTQLAGFFPPHLRRYRKILERILASSYCRRILCWLEEAKKGILLNLDCSGFQHKIEVVHRAMRPKQFARPCNKNTAKLLFVGSAFIPGEFENKGGREVLAAYEELSKRFDSLELVVRSSVPSGIKAKYERWDRLRIIDHIITEEELQYHFATADIFVMPAFHTPGMAILEGMAYELPIITIDSLGNRELVANGETGFVIPFVDKPEYYVWNRAPNPDITRLLKKDPTPDPVSVRGIVEKVTILVENPELRRRMGQAGRWEVEHGRFSIAARNEKLKRIFDEASSDVVL